ncbi:MAG TPA: hypothetical protein VFB16_16155 [Bauldia sp.]|nr:hypothetical protein [Bauldia sp.]
MAWRNWLGAGMAALALATAAGGASADERWHHGPAAPVIVAGTAEINPAAYDWVSDAGRQALTDLAARFKAGSVAAYAFAAAPGGNFWSLRSAAKASEIYNLPDLARAALQSCEYFAHVPCFIVSISGKDARDANGGLPVQPVQLTDPPAEFDATAVPFVGSLDQNMLAGFGPERRPKALAITVNGGWAWRTGDNVPAAVAQTIADCQKAYPNQVCLLYAVNNRVVFTASGPY